MITTGVVDLAYKLAPHSNGIRAQLALLRRCPQMWGPGLDHKLRVMCRDAMARLGITEDGEIISSMPPRELPTNLSYVQAKGYLTDWDYTETTFFQEQGWIARSDGAYPPLKRWIDTVCSRLVRNFGIPLFPLTIMVTEADHKRAFVLGEVDEPFGSSPHHHGFAVVLAHGVHLTHLPTECWEVLRGEGDEIAERQDLKLDQASGCPERWVVTGWRDLVGQALPEGEPVVEQQNFSRSPKGEKDELLRYYSNGTIDP